MDVTKLDRVVMLGETFTPNAPISRKDLFKGRVHEILSVATTVRQPGQHVAIFGERGVGKTSFASLLHELIPDLGLRSTRINCGTSDSFASLWRRAWQQMNLPLPSGDGWHEGSYLGLEPDDVRLQLEGIEVPTAHFIIFDEFDRVEDDEAISLMADTIKALSDHHSNHRVVVVGVAGSLDQLVGEHESVKRALKEVPMYRMQADEVRDLVVEGFERVQLAVTSAARSAVINASDGHPHFVHQICLTAGESVLFNDENEVQLEHVESAIREIARSHVLASKYEDAIRSARSDARYRHVLAACALATKSRTGQFRAKHVEAPMSRIMGEKFKMARFYKHLTDFTTDERGCVLQIDGRDYRFSDPQMQPFAIFAAIDTGAISENLKDELLSAEPQLPFDAL